MNFFNLEKRYPIIYLDPAKVHYINEYIGRTVNEIHWRLIEFHHKKSRKAIIGKMTLGSKSAIFHVSYCQCLECRAKWPLGFNFKEFRKLQKSPFGDLKKINPDAIYTDVNNELIHLIFCQCFQCQYYPKNVVPKFAAKMMKKLLIHSPYSCAEIGAVSDERLHPSLLRYKTQIIRDAVVKINKDTPRVMELVNQHFMNLLQQHEEAEKKTKEMSAGFVNGVEISAIVKQAISDAQEAMEVDDDENDLGELYIAKGDEFLHDYCKKEPPPPAASSGTQPMATFLEDFCKSLVPSSMPAEAAADERCKSIEDLKIRSFSEKPWLI